MVKVSKEKIVVEVIAMDNKMRVRYIAVSKKFFLFTMVGMAASLFSGICISNASLSFMQYFMHYALMFVGSVFFVKAIGAVHAYERKE